MIAQPIVTTPFRPKLALEKSKLKLPDQPKASLRSETKQSSLQCSETTYVDYLPGYPTVDLDQVRVDSFLAAELNTPVLDELYSILWLFSIKSGGNIDALHRQRIKGREIIPTEESKLHLVWTSEFLRPREQSSVSVVAGTPFNWKTALGFLRSYAYLVQSPLDLTMAKQAHLFPEDFEVDWISWAKFIAPFYVIDDTHVSKRYEFGQLRLNRLNWALRLVQPGRSRGWYYHRQHWSMGELLSGYFNVLLFAWASLSLVFSSMQVMVSISSDDLTFSTLGGQSSKYVSTAFWVFSLINVLGSGLTWLVLVLAPVLVFLVQIGWAVRHKGVPGPNGHSKRSESHVFSRTGNI